VQDVDDALDCGLVGGVLDVGTALVGDHPDGGLGEVAHHRLDVAPNVADLGVLRRLDLDERGARQRGEAPGDLGLPHAGRPDHQDVLGRDLFAEGVGEPLAAIAIAHRDGDGAFGVGLPDDVAVELRDDLAGREILGEFDHGSVST
jgi:hypothetical protein